MQQFKKSLLTKLKTNWQSKLSGFILLLMACGPGPADYNEFVSYFMPEATNAAAVDARYHFSPQFFYVDSYSDTLFDNQSINAQAWSDYTKNKVSVEAASDYFYKKNTGNKTLFNALKGNKEALGYLDFLKQIDLAYKPASNEWESPELDTLKLTPLLQTAKLGLSKTKDIFIKERYAFQAIKLACMAKQYQDAINLHETSVQEAKSQTFISNWSRSRYAGALLHLDKKEDAFYHFAQVFAEIGRASCRERV